MRVSKQDVYLSLLNPHMGYYNHVTLCYDLRNGQ